MKNYNGYSDEELIGMLRRGEAEVADYLLNKYKPLVRRKARASVSGRRRRQEDLLQEGMLGLFKAVQEYQPDKAASFQTFAGICVSRQMYVRRWPPPPSRQKHLPLNSSISLTELEENQEEYNSADG